MNDANLRILIVGGYGVFGGRLAQLLRNEKRCTLIIAGRSEARARAFCATMRGDTTMIAAAFDRNGDLDTQIKQTDPHIVVDASGPFQGYGQDPYRLVRAALALGVSYMDLADASDFVEGIVQFDSEAKERGVFLLSGVSSFPVLSAAVVRHLAQGLKQVDTITAGVAPSPYAGVGPNVIRAIVSYAGKPVSLTRDGEPSSGYGLTETMRYTICPPGRLPLKNKLFSLIDVPDLRLIPHQWSGASFDLDRRRASPRNIPLRPYLAGVRCSFQTAATAIVPRANTSPHHKYLELGGTSRWHVRQHRRVNGKRDHRHALMALTSQRR